MKDIMVDLETLGTGPRSAIIQIGAVEFDRHTGEIGEPFLVSVAQDFYEDAEHHGFVKDVETVAWWEKQSAAARSALTINKVSTPFIAMDKFGEWIDSTGFEASYDRSKGLIWANPPQFDLVILRHAAVKAYGDGDQVWWKYPQETCVRTLKNLVAPVDLGPAADLLIPHRADHDAIRQAMQVIEFTKMLP
jgi:hypothetical protein